MIPPIESTLESIRIEMIRRKISQRSLERRFDWGHGYLSNILSGRLDLKVKILYQILEAFEMSPSEFFRSLEVEHELEEAKRATLAGEAVGAVPETPARPEADGERLVEPARLESLFELLMQAGDVARKLHEQRGTASEEPLQQERKHG